MYAAVRKASQSPNSKAYSHPAGRQNADNFLPSIWWDHENDIPSMFRVFRQQQNAISGVTNKLKLSNIHHTSLPDTSREPGSHISSTGTPGIKVSK